MPQSLAFLKKQHLASLALAICLATGGFALAKNQIKPSPLQNSMAAYVVSQDAAGNEVFYVAHEVDPGQTIEYTMTYTNTGDNTLQDIVVTGPIPSATNYIDQSAFSYARAQLQVSIDGGNTFEVEPVVRFVTNANGKQVKQIIPPTKYTHIRWHMNQPLNAGETQKFSYRSIVK